jgi:hypothetical protein
MAPDPDEAGSRAYRDGLKALRWRLTLDDDFRATDVDADLDASQRGQRGGADRESKEGYSGYFHGGCRFRRAGV